MAKEVSGATINMSGRRGSREMKPTRRFMQDNELDGQVSESESKTGSRTKVPSARGRPKR